MTVLPESRDPEAAQRLRESGAVAIMRLRDHALTVEIGHALAEQVARARA